MAYRDTASYGKRQEYIAVAELLRRGFDVYMTLVDDQGVDCVVRLDSERYIDLQIKARSKTAKMWNAFGPLLFEPRANYYFMFYTERDGNYWIIPSLELEPLCFKNKTGKYVGRMRVDLPKSTSAKKAKQYERFRNENGFKLLREAMNGSLTTRSTGHGKQRRAS